MNLAFHNPAGFEIAVMQRSSKEERIARIASDIAALCLELAEADSQSTLNGDFPITLVVSTPKSTAPGVPYIVGRESIIEQHYTQELVMKPGLLYIHVLTLIRYANGTRSIPGFDQGQMRRTIRHYLGLLKECGHSVNLSIPVVPDVVYRPIEGLPGTSPGDWEITPARASGQAPLAFSWGYAYSGHVIWKASCADLAHCLRKIQTKGIHIGVVDKLLSEIALEVVTIENHRPDTLYSALRKCKAPRKKEIRDEKEAITHLGAVLSNTAK